MKWEVKRVIGWESVEQFASEGWELVALDHDYYYLKRPIAAELRMDANSVKNSWQDFDRALRDYIEQVGVRQLV